MSQSTSAESSNKEVHGITRISVQGFKSLYDECSIEIRPLTILAGANSSGKSSIMQPLLLMKQTLEAPYDPGALLLNGPNVKFTLAEQLLSCIPKISFNNKFSIKIEINNYLFIENIFELKKETGIKLFCTKIYLGYGFLMEIANDSQVMIKTDPKIRQYYPLKIQQQKNVNPILISSTINKSNAERNRCFLEPKSDKDTNAIFKTFEPFKEKIRQLIYVSGLRGNPERTYNTTAVGMEFPGIIENYVASIIYNWQFTGDNRISNLKIALNQLGITSRIDARKINDVQIELRVGRLPRGDDANDMISIADVGIGVSQVLPVLVALLVAKPGQLVYIEQPELHLHPRAQAALANILADAAKRGVRVVIETHSELLLLAVQSLVAERQLSPDLVKLHWFTRGDDGMTKISSADLDEAGAFGDFPEDFSDVSLKLESRYLNAAESRLSEGTHGG